MKLIHKLLVVACLVMFLGSSTASYAQESSSTNYRINESSFGIGGDIDSNSASYNARTSVGNIGVGESTSTNFGIFAGPITPKEEYLEIYVNVVNVDLGNLSPSATATGTSTFYVRAYLNSNYNVLTVSNSLSNENGNQIDGMAVAGAPVTGTEQFGINLVDNSSPNIGANPVPQPNSTFANGQAATGYDTVNNFKYVSGDAVAQNGTSGRAWGQTDYTVSYIANVSDITPAGLYTMRQDLVVVATY